MSHDLPNELRAFEASLAALAPRADSLGHDLILFQAGRRSAMRTMARRRRVLMPIALAATTTAAAAMFVMLLTRPIIERVEIVHAPPVVEQEDEVEVKIKVEPQPVDDDSSSLALVPPQSIRTSLLTAERVDEILHPRPPRIPSHDSPSTPLEMKDPVPYYQQLQELLAEQTS